MKKLLLSLLKDARQNVPSEPQPCDYPQLHRLAVVHDVTALVYSQIYQFPDFPEQMKWAWSRETIKINALQTMRSSRFLQLYQKLTDAGVTGLVVKGLVLRSLYPQPENRPSNDEDLYVNEQQFEQASKIFLAEGLRKVVEGKGETTFLDASCGLSIELHTALFYEESKAYGHFQQLFRDAFKQPETHMIQGVPVKSLSCDLHLMFLITHLAKHFLVSGVGIRQVLDIVMYSEAYGDRIHWEQVYKELDKVSLLPLTLNVFAIGHKYLGMDYGKIQLYPDYKKYEDPEALLDDILDAGVFGKSTQARLHSSAFTVEAASQEKRSRISVLWRHLFLPLADLRERAGYGYLKEKPWLLPAAQLHRIIHYMTHRENQGQEKKMMEMGAQRVELLKKYGMIQ